VTVEPRKGLGAPERPIESSTEDKLERYQFVRRLASALIDGKTGRSRGVVIGITGPWGSGKSSILNLLRERLNAGNPQTVVVSFDPWLISGRNDLISAFIKELLATIKSDPKVADKLKSVTATFAKYGRLLEPAASYLNPAVRAALKMSTNVAETLNSRDESLSALRRKLLAELAESAMPIVVLIDELDRIEDQEIRTVAQLVRSVADFPGISYVLAYDHDRVVQALGEGAVEEKRTERGRAYLEKIVQLQIPLPITFGEEICRLLSAELIPLQQELHLPENFENIERYEILIKLLSRHVIETPRDIKRLIGTFHVLCGMLNQEVDWIDLLAYSTLLVKAPGTVSYIRSNPRLS
jgi:predicted KAP-like P-loop ATPase